MTKFQAGDIEMARRGSLALQKKHAEAQRLARRAADLEAALRTAYVFACGEWGTSEARLAQIRVYLTLYWRAWPRELKYKKPTTALCRGGLFIGMG